MSQDIEEGEISTPLDMNRYVYCRNNPWKYTDPTGKSVTAYSLMGLTAYPGKLIGGSLYFNGHQVEEMTDKEMRKIRGNEISIISRIP